MKFATITNRGAKLCVGSKEEADRVADDLNARNADVFAWVVEVPDDEEPADLPGRGVFYG